MKPKTVLLIAAPAALAVCALVAMSKGSPAAATDTSPTLGANQEKEASTRLTKAATRGERDTAPAPQRTTPTTPEEEDPALAGPVDEGIAPPAQPVVATEALLADYRSEAFAALPRWLPRPLQAERAVPENNSLRSDGLSEGAVRYSFSGDAAAQLATLQEHLLQSGFTANENKTTFTAEDPPRTCTLAITGSQIVATYQMKDGHNHAPGEACSCGH